MLNNYGKKFIKWGVEDNKDNYVLVKLVILFDLKKTF